MLLSSRKRSCFVTHKISFDPDSTSYVCIASFAGPLLFKHAKNYRLFFIFTQSEIIILLFFNHSLYLQHMNEPLLKKIDIHSFFIIYTLKSLYCETAARTVCAIRQTDSFQQIGRIKRRIQRLNVFQRLTKKMNMAWDSLSMLVMSLAFIKTAHTTSCFSGTFKF